jgi:hypothetical protein
VFCLIIFSTKLSLIFTRRVQVRDGIHTFLAQAVLEKWQQASICASLPPLTLLPHSLPIRFLAIILFYSRKHISLLPQHNGSAYGHSVRLQLLQAFAMVVKVHAHRFFRNHKHCSSSSHHVTRAAAALVDRRFRFIQGEHGTADDLKCGR